MTTDIEIKNLLPEKYNKHKIESIIWSQDIIDVPFTNMMVKVPGFCEYLEVTLKSGEYFKFRKDKILDTIELIEFHH